MMAIASAHQKDKVMSARPDITALVFIFALSDVTNS